MIGWLLISKPKCLFFKTISIGPKNFEHFSFKSTLNLIGNRPQGLPWNMPSEFLIVAFG